MGRQAGRREWEETRRERRPWGREAGRRGRGHTRVRRPLLTHPPERGGGRAPRVPRAPGTAQAPDRALAGTPSARAPPRPGLEVQGAAPRRMAGAGCPPPNPLAGGAAPPSRRTLGPEVRRGGAERPPRASPGPSYVAWAEAAGSWSGGGPSAGAAAVAAGGRAPGRAGGPRRGRCCFWERAGTAAVPARGWPGRAGPPEPEASGRPRGTGGRAAAASAGASARPADAAPRGAGRRQAPGAGSPPRPRPPAGGARRPRTARRGAAGGGRLQRGLGGGGGGAAARRGGRRKREQRVSAAARRVPPGRPSRSARWRRPGGEGGGRRRPGGRGRSPAPPRPAVPRGRLPARPACAPSSSGSRAAGASWPAAGLPALPSSGGRSAMGCSPGRFFLLRGGTGGGGGRGGTKAQPAGGSRGGTGGGGARLRERSSLKVVTSRGGAGQPPSEPLGGSSLSGEKTMSQSLRSFLTCGARGSPGPRLRFWASSWKDVMVRWAAGSSLTSLRHPASVLELPSVAAVRPAHPESSFAGRESPAMLQPESLLSAAFQPAPGASVSIFQMGLIFQLGSVFSASAFPSSSASGSSEAGRSSSPPSSSSSGPGEGGSWQVVRALQLESKPGPGGEEAPEQESGEQQKLSGEQAPGPTEPSGEPCSRGTMLG